MDATELIRAEVNKRFTSDAFYVRLADAMYERALRFEMKHLWDMSRSDFKGADEYRLYVREKIKLHQRLRYWEDMLNYYHYSRPHNHNGGASAGHDEAYGMVVGIEGAIARLKRRRLELREKIGEIDYV